MESLRKSTPYIVPLPPPLPPLASLPCQQYYKYSTYISALVCEVVRAVSEPQSTPLASKRLVGLTYPLVDGAGGGRATHPRPILVRGEDGGGGWQTGWK